MLAGKRPGPVFSGEPGPYELNPTLSKTTAFPEVPRAEKLNPVGQPAPPIVHCETIFWPTLSSAIPASSGMSVVAVSAFWVPIIASGIAWNAPPLPPRLLSEYLWPAHRNQVLGLITVAPLTWHPIEDTFAVWPKLGLKPF